MTTRNRVLSMLLAVLMLGSLGAFAQGYPSKPIHIVVPYAAGGATDAYARVFAGKYAEAWGQPVIVDNRPGAGGNVGAELVARSAPDGYTWLLHTAAQAMAPGLFKKLNYDPAKDLVPAVQLVSTGLILAVNNDLPVHSVKELVARASAQPGKLNFGSTGVGSAPHLVGEMLRSSASIDIVHVPYKGDVQLTPALIANEVQIAFLPSGAALPMIKAKKILALAFTGRTRSAGAPDLPTMAEAGYPAAEYNGWTSLFVPAGTPNEIVVRMGSEVAKFVRMPDMQKYFAAWGVEPPNVAPDALPARYKAEIDKYVKVIRDAHIPQVD